MQKIYAGSRACRDHSGREYRFDYYILIEEIHAGGLCCEHYGVLVRDGSGNRSAVPGITPCRSRLEGLLALLMDNVVTPIDLPDVIQDWL